MTCIKPRTASGTPARRCPKTGKAARVGKGTGIRGMGGISSRAVTSESGVFTHVSAYRHVALLKVKLERRDREEVRRTGGIRTGTMRYTAHIIVASSNPWDTANNQWATERRISRSTSYISKEAGWVAVLQQVRVVAVSLTCSTYRLLSATSCAGVG